MPSPKLRRIATLFMVTSAKHCSLRESEPSNMWSHIFFSPVKRSLTCFKQNKVNYRSKNCLLLVSRIVHKYAQRCAYSESNFQFWPLKPPIAFSVRHPCWASQHPASEDSVPKLNHERPLHRVTRTEKAHYHQLWAREDYLHLLSRGLCWKLKHVEGKWSEIRKCEKYRHRLSHVCFQ